MPDKLYLDVIRSVPYEMPVENNFSGCGILEEPRHYSIRVDDQFHHLNPEIHASRIISEKT